MKSLLLDAVVGLVLVYAGVCIYEGANLVALAALGAQPTLITQGILPVGVSASVSQSSHLVLAKPLQIALSAAAMLAVFRATRSVGQFSRTLALTTLSIYLASAYWELFSSVGPASYEAHLAIFVVIAVATQFGLTGLLDRRAPPVQPRFLQEL